MTVGEAATCVLLAGALLLAGCGQHSSGVELRTDDPVQLARGKALYEARCAACHGSRLEGQPNWRERDSTGRLPAPPHDASGHTWHHPDQVLFTIVKHGVAKAAKLQDYPNNMPAYEGVLTDEEIVAVLSWIKSQWPPDIRQRQEEVDRASRRTQ